MGSFCESRSGGPLWHQDALRLEKGPQGEGKDIFIFKLKSVKETLCVLKNKTVCGDQRNWW